MNNIINAIAGIFVIIGIVYTLYQMIKEKKKDQQDPIKINFLQVRLDNYVIMLMIIALLWMMNNQTSQIVGIYSILDGMNDNLTNFASNFTDFAGTLTDHSSNFTKFLSGINDALKGISNYFSN